MVERHAERSEASCRVREQIPSMKPGLSRGVLAMVQPSIRVATPAGVSHSTVRRGRILGDRLSRPKESSASRRAIRHEHTLQFKSSASGRLSRPPRRSRPSEGVHAAPPWCSPEGKEAFSFFDSGRRQRQPGRTVRREASPVAQHRPGDHQQPPTDRRDRDLFPIGPPAADALVGLAGPRVVAQ